MKLKLYILTALTFVSIIFGCYSVYNMILQCHTPYYIKCVGKKLSPNTVIAISNNKVAGRDTLNFNFEQSKWIMPTTLAYLSFNKFKKQFELQNNTCVFNAATTIPTNYFLPYCVTLDFTGGGTQKPIFFGNERPVTEEMLLQHGLKWNTAAGDRNTRVSLQLFKYKGETYIRYNDDGINTKYLIKRKEKNIFDIFINQPVLSPNAFIFKFDNTSLDTNRYSIEITTSVFKAYSTLKDGKGLIVSRSHGSNYYVEARSFLFQIEPKYSYNFFIFYLSFFVILVAFQLYLLYTAAQAVNPIMFSLSAVRILINCIIFLSVPLFLTAYYLGTNRSIYLGLVILLNVSYFTSKKFLHNIKLSIKSKWGASLLWAFIVIATILIKPFTVDENLFGRIPVLHVQKFLLLLLILATQKSIFQQIKYGNWFRITIILSYSVLLSILTSDIGSVLFAGLSLLLVELIRKSISMKETMICVGLIVVAITLIYHISPDSVCQYKGYRLLAPYTNPASKKLIESEEQDRETYATLILNFKNLFFEKTPRFNEVAFPASMRTTIHTDYAVVGGYMLGGFIFFVPFVFVLFYLVKELLLLLFFATRRIRVNKSFTYALPNSSESELIRVFLAFSIIQFCYPLFSNMLLLPVTGQSLPGLSISNIEIIFLILLLVPISSIFSNPKYYSETTPSNYLYGDAVKSLNFGLFVLASLVITGIIIKVISLYRTENIIQWTKQLSDKNIKLKTDFPPAINKQGLINYAKSIIGDDKLYNVSTNKKPVLKELTSLYFSSRPYSQSIYESKTFENSTARLLRQTVIDSAFTVKRRLISGINEPFGKVYSIMQKVNDKQYNSISNPYYSSIPANGETINTDLTAEATRALELHLARIGVASNIGSIWVVDYNTGNVIANSSFPLNAEMNSAEIYYLCGSVKKMLLAYCALKINPTVKDIRYYSTKFKRDISFTEFIQWSDNDYAANLLKNLLLTSRERLNTVLQNDFDLPLYSATDDSYIDVLPRETDFKKKLDRNNVIYRQAVGQEKPYKFSIVMQWYSRFASGKKVNLKYSIEDRNAENISMNQDDLKYLQNCFSMVLQGTAAKVRKPLLDNGINVSGLFCKTGTAEGQDRKGNVSSTFIICNRKYCIGVELKGLIPDSKENRSAKDLFVELIPILKKYCIF
jgi:hypothetical protein